MTGGKGGGEGGWKSQVLCCYHRPAVFVARLGNPQKHSGVSMDLCNLPDDDIPLSKGPIRGSRFQKKKKRERHCWEAARVRQRV